MNTIMKFRLCFFLFICYLGPSPVNQRSYMEKLQKLMGPIDDCDCIFVQAFGRGDIADEYLVEWLRPIIADDLMLTLARIREAKIDGFGFNPGMSNFDLAEVSKELMEGNERLLIAQWEVVYAHYLVRPEWVEANRRRIVALWPGKKSIAKRNWFVRLSSKWLPELDPEKRYYTTVDVKIDSVKVMRSRGKSRPIELSHQNMAVRSLAIIFNLGVFAWLYYAWIANDPKSVQRWTRSDELWAKKEVFGRVFHILAGWVSFWPPHSR
ncbi:MAG: hypothetical protein WC107_03650 [Patescibacteria group bacterium]